jgi:hypothetical protein
MLESLETVVPDSRESGRDSCVQNYLVIGRRCEECAVEKKLGRQ